MQDQKRNASASSGIMNRKWETGREMTVFLRKRSEKTYRCAKFYKHRAIKLSLKNSLH
jgi:hypothetical protein